MLAQRDAAMLLLVVMLFAVELPKMKATVEK